MAKSPKQLTPDTGETDTRFNLEHVASLVNTAVDNVVNHTEEEFLDDIIDRIEEGKITALSEKQYAWVKAIAERDESDTGVPDAFQVW